MKNQRDPELQGERWQPPPELERMRPRSVRLTVAGKAAVVAVVALLASALFAGIWLYVAAERDRERLELLKQQGRRTQAEVAERGRTKGDQTRYFVVYRYTVDAQSYRGRANVRRSVWQKLGLGSSLQVYYLPSKPDRSWLPGREPNGVPPWVVPLVPIGLALATWPILYHLRRQWRLLSEGRAALAHVTHSKRVSRSHGGAVHRAHYEFQILSGAVRTGRCDTAKTMPTGSTLTIVYDPDDPQCQARYPLSLVRVA